MLIRQRDCCSEHLAGVEESLEEEKREKLKYKILMGFETELALILDVLRQFNDANQVSLFTLSTLSEKKNKYAMYVIMIIGLEESFDQFGVR